MDRHNGIDSVTIDLAARQVRERIRYGYTAAIAMLLSGIATACLSPSPTPSLPNPPAPTEASPTVVLPSPVTATPTVPIPTIIPSPVPPKEISICLGEEPNTLFIYGGPSRAARNVLEAIYDGPSDTRAYELQPVILEKLPSLADGDAALEIVEVGEGSKVVDYSGAMVDLLPGVTVFDGSGQAVTFQGGTALMTQMVVTFTLRAGVSWSDGQPLTTDDFRYSFEVVSGLDTPSDRWLYDRTSSLDVVGERALVWTGIPGHRDASYPLSFYPPLPRHVWGTADFDQLLNTAVAHRNPLGWGPFVLEEWEAGSHISLVRNPHYFRAGEGLPYLDRVRFRFISDPQQALGRLAAGECDLIAQDVIENADSGAVLAAVDNGEVQLASSPSSEWEHLDFGIEPAGWTSLPHFFGDVRVRQALARCVDRERIAREADPFGGGLVAHSYVGLGHPLLAGGELPVRGHDLAGGQLLLDEVGWVDQDGDGIREAHGVEGIRNGTPFTITLLATIGDSARERTAQILVENLAVCGVGLSVEALPPEEFFADGPDGPVFGRRFALALFSWMNSLDAPCGLYVTSQIPRPENWWASSNNPGYSNVDYDAACLAAMRALPGTTEYSAHHMEAQRIFAGDLPVLPLYFVPKHVAIRPGVRGVILDPGQSLELWNIEAFDVQPAQGA